MKSYGFSIFSNDWIAFVVFVLLYIYLSYSPNIFSQRSSDYVVCYDSVTVYIVGNKNSTNTLSKLNELKYSKAEQQIERKKEYFDFELSWF